MQIFDILKPILPLSLKQIILEKYAEPHRHYHTFTHIQSLFDMYSTYQDLITFKTEFLLAILFHDIIYDPTKNDNELLSIDFFITQKLDLKDESKDLVVEMIKATITHQSVPLGGTSQLDLELFLDCDLSILGTDPKVYEKYAADIRKEYRCYDDERYRKGRMEVLKKLLGKKRLFYRMEVDGIVEVDRKARVNIAKELEGLSRGDL